MPTENLVNIRNLSVGFTARDGSTLPILRQVNFHLGLGKSVGLVGESGSGKSTLALAAMGYLKHGLRVLDGEVRFHDLDMLNLPQHQLQTIRGRRLALIPQNSGQSLTPSLRVGTQLAETLKLHTSTTDDATQQQQRVTELLTMVRLPDPHLVARKYPHELSGGQQQRVAIAMALAGEPEALILDEPTTGLDVTTQAHILELLRDLSSQYSTSMLYVSHDLGAIARVCERVAVMYAGEIVLEGSTREVLSNPTHPYARGLLASIPRLNSAHLPSSLPGIPPLPGVSGSGCAFAPRCAIVTDMVPKCRLKRPTLTHTRNGQHARCHRWARAKQIPLNRISDSTDSQPPSTYRGSQEIMLSLTKVSIDYSKPRLFERFRDAPETVPTVDDVSFALRKGETLALVGESGSGKSTILKAIAGLLPTLGGSIQLQQGKPLAPQLERRNSEALRKIQLIFQNPDESLNPRQSIAEIIAQPLQLYFKLKAKALHQRSVEILRTVRLDASYLARLPSQLSGGEKQRVAVARAFAAKPDIVLCDEVTSALDVSVQAAVLELLDALRQQRETTYLFVSHDLAVVRTLAHRVAVLYQGRLCEIGDTAQVYAAPSHPYTDALLSAVLEPDPDSVPRLSASDVVESSPPATGCPFQRRCARRVGSICDNESPPWRSPTPQHHIRCHLSVEELRGDDPPPPEPAQA